MIRIQKNSMGDTSKRLDKRETKKDRRNIIKLAGAQRLQRKANIIFFNQLVPATSVPLRDILLAYRQRSIVQKSTPQYGSPYCLAPLQLFVYQQLLLVLRYCKYWSNVHF